MPLTVLLQSEGVTRENGPPALTFDAPRVVIGRGDGCEVRLPDPSVSARHATLRQHGGSYLLLDEGSTNGTFVGGVRLAAHAPRVVADGDLVRVGRVWLELRLSAAAQPSSPQDTRELALALVARALESMGESPEPRLVVRAGPDAGKTLALPSPGAAYVLGRGHGVDLALDEADASRRHVTVTRRGDQLLVRDLGSKNGTFIGDTPLDPARDAVLRAGERFRVGEDEIAYENPAAEALLELERGADEKMREGEPVAPPAGAHPDEGRDPAAAEPSRAEAGAGAPIAQRPRRDERSRTVRRGGGWAASDVVIVVIALGVLVLSAAGLFVLFRA